MSDVLRLFEASIKAARIKACEHQTTQERAQKNLSASKAGVRSPWYRFNLVAIEAAAIRADAENKVAALYEEELYMLNLARKK